MTELAAKTNERIDRIREMVEIGLAPSSVTIADDSHLHAGHAGARDGRGHYRIEIVASRFEGLPMIERHRLVYFALGKMMTTDIHALQICALTPGEADKPSAPNPGTKQ